MYMKRKEFIQGCKDGMSIGIGYFAVSFALGIAMKNAGLNWLEGFFMSLTNLASAGEYAGTQVILTHGTYVEMAIMTFVANARYMLMSCSLSQKLSPEVSVKKRLLIGYSITDELFGLAYSRKGKLDPHYFYGGMSVAILPWALGTACGIVVGNILPTSLVSALSVALYGMFLAIIIPSAKTDRFVLILIFVSFLLSFLSGVLPMICKLSSGTRIILLTIFISTMAAIIKSVRIEEKTCD